MGHWMGLDDVLAVSHKTPVSAVSLRLLHHRPANILQPVGIKDSVQMVDLVLEDDSGVAADGVAYRPFRVLGQCVFHDDLLRAKDVSASVRYGKAALGTICQGVGRPDDPDVRIDLERLSGLVEALYGYDPAVYAYLRCCKADSVLRRVGDCLEHETAEVHEVVGPDGSGREVGAGRTKHGIVETILYGQDSEYAVCAIYESALFGLEPSRSLVRHISSHDYEEGDRQYEE